MKNNITYRKASPEDKLLVFEWSNEKTVRENSFHSGEILFEEHSQWFDKKLEDENSDFIIVEMHGEAICFVRFDKNKEYSTVGINLDKHFRGNSLAAQILEESCQDYKQNTGLEIHAFIKKENIASIRSFEKAGFVLLQETTINGCESFEFKYLKNGK